MFCWSITRCFLKFCSTFHHSPLLPSQPPHKHVSWRAAGQGGWHCSAITSISTFGPYCTIHNSLQGCRNMDSGAWEGAVIHSGSQLWLKGPAARKHEFQIHTQPHLCDHSPGFCAWQPRSPPCCWVSAHPGFPHTVEKKQRKIKRRD